MTVWIVIGVLVGVLLAGTALMDHRSRRRGAAVRGDIGTSTGRNPALGNPDAYRVDGQNTGSSP